MDWQTILVTLTVAVAVGYLLHRHWRTWTHRSRSCGGGCSCPGKTAESQRNEAIVLIAPEQLTLRERNIGSR